MNGMHCVSTANQNVLKLEHSGRCICYCKESKYSLFLMDKAQDKSLFSALEDETQTKKAKGNGQIAVQ